MNKPRIVFRDGQWADKPQPLEGTQILRQQIADLQQDLLRSEQEKGRLYGELESLRRQCSDAQRERQRLLNERGTLRLKALRIWVSIGKRLRLLHEDD